MDDVTGLITLALAVVTLATAAGLGLQRGRIASLQGQLDESDKELKRVKDRHTEAIAELKVVRADLEALGRVVTGEAHWVAIGDKLDVHHAEATAHWTNDERILAEIRDRLPKGSGR